MRMKYILAIDQGTTGSRVVVYNKSGCVVACAYQEFPQYFPQPGWVEHNPIEIWKSVTACVAEVSKRVSLRHIAAIGIANQRETTVVWDRETGVPVYNAIVWQCRRTAFLCDVLKQKKGEAAWFQRRTGLPIDAYFSATKLQWILASVPHAAARARAGTLVFGTIDSWLLWKLTAGAVHATDYTNASRTMLFDIASLSWSNDILAKLAIPAGMMPRVKPSSGCFGVTAARGVFPGGIPISGIAGDQQAALFGQGCFQEGSIKNTYGTGCFLLLNLGKKKPVFTKRLVTTLACGPCGEPVYAFEGSVFIAGAAVQWLRDGLNIISFAHESEKLAQSVADTGGVYFVPAFVGLGAPYWRQDARGLITGITRGTSRAHVVRAAVEAMCYQSKDVLDAMCVDSGLRAQSLRVDGGASANDFLCQFQADILGIPVSRPKIVETTALGAAYLAGLAAGYWKNIGEIIMRRHKDTTFFPAMPKSTADTYYRGWQAAVKKTLMV